MSFRRLAADQPTSFAFTAENEAWARRQLAGLIAQADAVLEPFGARAALLRQAAAFVGERRK